jgi:hypothetical protein
MIRDCQTFGNPLYCKAFRRPVAVPRGLSQPKHLNRLDCQPGQNRPVSIQSPSDRVSNP